MISSCQRKEHGNIGWSGFITSAATSVGRMNARTSRSFYGMGKSTLVGRWVRQLENRLYTPVNLTQATLSSSGLLASLARYDTQYDDLDQRTAQLN